MAQGLLVELQGLCHSARIKRVIHLGRESLVSAEAKAILDGLSSLPGVFAQSMALYAANSSRDVAFCRRVLASTSSKTLRELARTVLVDISSDGDLPEVLLHLCGMASTSHPGKLLHILHRLHKGGRSNATAHVVHAVALLADPSAACTTPAQLDTAPGKAPPPQPLHPCLSLTDTPDDRVRLLAQILPFGNEQQVTLLLSKLETRVTGIEGWTDLPLLVQWHPRPTTEFLARQHHTTRARLMAVATKQLLHYAPEATLGLFNSLPVEYRTGTVDLITGLTSKFPDRMVDILMTLRAIDDDKHSLNGYMQRAAAARKQLLAQRAAAAAAAAAGGPAAAPPAPAAPAASGSQLDTAMTSAGSNQGTDDDDSWVAPTSVGSVASMETGSVGTAAGVGGGEGAGVGGAAGSDGAREVHPVYGLAAREVLHATALSFKEMFQSRKWAHEATLTDGIMLQSCLSGLRLTSKVLRRLSVERRSQLYGTWRTWWGQQVSRLDQVESQLAPQALDARKTLTNMRTYLQGEAVNMWHPASSTARWLPGSSLVDLIELLLTQFVGHSPAEALAYALMTSERVPSAQLLRLLMHPHPLWKKSMVGNLSLLLRQLSATQQAQYVSNPSALVPANTLVRTVAALSPRTPSAHLLMKALTDGRWHDALKLEGGAEEARQVLNGLSVDARERAVVCVLEALPSEADVAGLLLRAVALADNQPANAAVAAEGLMTSLSLRPRVLEDVYKLWEASLSPSPVTPGAPLPAALTRLAGAAPASTQYALYRATGLAIRLAVARRDYKVWLATMTNQGGASVYKDVYVGVQRNQPLASLLPPSCRVSLLLRAALDAKDIHGPSWMDPVLGVVPTTTTTTTPSATTTSASGSSANSSASSVISEPVKVLQLLVSQQWGAAMMKGLSTEQAKQVLDALPGLWVKAPQLLSSLSGADRMSLLSGWQASRTGVEGALAQLLASASAEEGSAETSGGAAPMDISSDNTAGGGAGGGVEGPRVALVPTYAAELAVQSKSLLSVKGDPVVGALVDGTLPLPSPQERALLYTITRDVLLEEWVTVRMELLPPHVRAMVARARILRATEQHQGPIGYLFSKVEGDLPYLTWREITDTPCFKDRLQARDAGQRATALQFLITAVKVNADLLPHLLGAIHMRRREQDDTRSKVLASLDEVVAHLGRATADKNLTAIALAQAEAVALSTLPEGHEAAPALKQAALTAATAAASGPAPSATTLASQADSERAAQVLLNNLQGLALIFKDALSARDLSKESLDRLTSIAKRMLPVAPDWSSSQLSLLLTHGGVAAVPVDPLIQAVKDQLACLQKRCDEMRCAAQAAVEEEAAGKKGEWKFLNKTDNKTTKDPSARPPGEGRRHSGRATHRGAQAHAVKAALESQRKPPDEFKGVHDNLQECYLLEVTSKVLPCLMAALGKRQDGLYSVLKLAQAWSDLLFLLGPRKQSQVDVWRAVQPAFTALLLTLIDPVAALKSAAGCPAATEGGSVGMVAWFADQVLLREPDQYHRVKHLMLPTDRVLAALVKPHLMNSVHNSLPVGRLDLVLPFIEENSSMPDVAAKALKIFFTYHGEQVASVVPRLLSKDPTFIMLPKVFWFVVRHHQDLLPSLASPLTSASGAPLDPPKGLFSDGAPTSMVPGGAGAVRGRIKAERMVAARGKRGGGGGRGGRGGRGGGRGRGGCVREKSAAKKPRNNQGGWSKGAGMCTSLWLGMPTLTFSSTMRLAPTQQEAVGRELVSALVSKGALDLHVVRGLVRRLAALPALPPSHLLGLLDSAVAAGATTEGAGGGEGSSGGAEGGGGGGGGALSYEAMQDVVLAALIKLDDGSQAWGALVEALNKGSSSTALSAVSALLAADIRALGGAGGAATEGQAQAQAGAAGVAAGGDGGSRAAELVGKMRQLPWQRPAALREVIKLLAALASRSPTALEELMRIAAYAAAGLKQVTSREPAAKLTTTTSRKDTPATRAGSTAVPAAAAVAAVAMAVEGPVVVAGVVDTSSLPLPAGKELHRSAHLQLLTSLQDFYGLPEVQRVFEAAALAEDKEIATSSAFVPGKALQKTHKGCIKACVQLFETLIKHPEKDVRVATMKAWANAPNTLSLGDGLPVIMRIVALKKRKGIEGREARTCASSWCARVIEASGPSRNRGGGGGDAMMMMSKMAGGGDEDDDDEEESDEDEDEGEEKEGADGVDSVGEDEAGLGLDLFGAGQEGTGQGAGVTQTQFTVQVSVVAGMTVRQTGQ